MTAFLSVNAQQAADTADGLGSLVRYDRQWVYQETNMHVEGFSSYNVYYLGFNGSETVNGKTYHKLCPLKFISRGVDYDDEGNAVKYFNALDAQDVPESGYGKYGVYPILMRQEGDRVYMVVPEGMEIPYDGNPAGETPNAKPGDEVLLYDFSVRTGDAVNILCGYKETPEYFRAGEVSKTEMTDIGGESVRSYEVDFGYGDVPWDPCKIVEGIGSLNVGMLHYAVIDFMTSMNYYPPCLRAVVDGNDEVIYGNLISTPKQRALDLIRLDGEWEYVYDDGTFATMRFDGEETVDGAVYHRFVTTATATPDSENPGQFTYDFAPAAAPALLRQAGNRLLRLVCSDGGNTLYCLYDFDTQLNGTCSVLMDSEGDMSRRYMEYTGLDMYKVGDEWCALHKLRDTQPDPAEGTVFEGNVLQTVGPLAGGTLAGFGTDAAHGPCRLNRLYDLAGNTLYTAAGVDSPLASVKGVSADNGSLSISIDRGCVNVTSAGVDKTTLDIYTIDGRRMTTQSGAGNITVSTAALQPGLYIARATVGSRQASAKFTVR